MSWIQTSTESFTVPIDFYDLLGLSADTDGTISAMINKNYIGKNFHGKHLTKLVSVDGHHEPFLNLTDAFVTMTVMFTAETIRLLPDKIIPDILVQKSKKSDTHFGIKEIGPGSNIRVVYNIGYNDVLNGALFPTKLREITHNPHSRDITAIGEILVPFSGLKFYRHDESTESSDQTSIVKPLSIDGEAATTFDKIKQLYVSSELKSDTGNLKTLSSFNHSDAKDKIYTLQGPLGPIMELKSNTNIGDMKWEDIVESANLVNMYDIEKNAIDANNAIKIISEMYLDDEHKNKIKPYIALVNIIRKRSSAPTSTNVSGGDSTDRRRK